MDITVKRTSDTLYIYLGGELDEHNARAARERADSEIDAHAGVGRVVIDLAGVRFMDSSAIGFLIGRYKKLQKYGMGMYLENPNAGADKVLTLSGVYSLMPKI